jgi:hypothetical protein
MTDPTVVSAQIKRDESAAPSLVTWEVIDAWVTWPCCRLTREVIEITETWLPK